VASLYVQIGIYNNNNNNDNNNNNNTISNLHADNEFLERTSSRFKLFHVNIMCKRFFTLTHKRIIHKTA